MDFIKRILILSGTKNEQKRGYLTLNKKSDSLLCLLKTFNLDYTKDYFLTISVEDKILSNILVDSSCLKEFSFNLSNKLDISKKINVLLCETKTNDAVLFGSTVGERIENLAYLKSKSQNIFSPQKEIEPTEQISFKEEQFEIEEEKIETEIDNEVSKLSLEDSEEDLPFFTLVQSQVEEMFTTYPEYDELTGLVKNSKWIKVDYDNDGLFYALGLIYEDDKVKYICYAVPSSNSFSPPEHLSEFCQWLEKEPSSSDGYFVMYQDAENGTSVKM